jgi:hypothetical protein
MSFIYLTRLESAVADVFICALQISRVVSSSSAIEDDDDGKLIFHPPEWKSEFFIRYPFFPFNFRRSFPRLNKMISNRNSSNPRPWKNGYNGTTGFVLTSGSGCIQRTSVKCKTVVICLFVHTHTTQHSSLTPMNVKIKRGDYNRFFSAVVSNGVECIIGPCLLLGLSAADWWREKREKKRLKFLFHLSRESKNSWCPDYKHHR